MHARSASPSPGRGCRPPTFLPEHTRRICLLAPSSQEALKGAVVPPCMPLSGKLGPRGLRARPCSPCNSRFVGERCGVYGICGVCASLASLEPTVAGGWDPDVTWCNNRRRTHRWLRHVPCTRRHRPGGTARLFKRDRDRDLLTEDGQPQSGCHKQQGGRCPLAPPRVQTHGTGAQHAEDSASGSIPAALSALCCWLPGCVNRTRRRTTGPSKMMALARRGPSSACCLSLKRSQFFQGAAGTFRLRVMGWMGVGLRKRGRAPSPVDGCVRLQVHKLSRSAA